MSWTKRQLVVAAFEELGLAAYVFDLSADQLQSALYRLDAMMASWGSVGIAVGYPMAQDPAGSDIDQDSSLPDWAVESVYTNLALRIAPGYGKTPPAELASNARSSYDGLLNQFALPPQMQLPGSMPRGAGQRPRSIAQPFLTPPTTPPIQTKDNGQLEFLTP